ncbi:MAG: class I adenylate-forming enzyme family protein [Phycisphaerae bacterium]|nr:class I adenylate-forming enzyme family protein [Phycisphaerae bacterium]
MLFQLVQDAGLRWGSSDVLVSNSRSVSFGKVASRARELVDVWSGFAGTRVGLTAAIGVDWLAAAAAIDALGSTAFLIPGDPTAPELRSFAEVYKLTAVLDAPALPTSVAQAPWQNASSSVVLFTSGTSGQPKAVLHTWESLASGIKRSDKLLGMRMLLTYDLARYAGLQVLLTALTNGATLCIPPSRNMADIVRTVIDEHVELVSGTPTFWRMLLANSADDQIRRMSLRQITLGGEAISQPILDALRTAFPAARITHIYASTEMGVCFSVHDGREGFPTDFLQGDALPVRLKVEDGRLWIQSGRSMAGYLNGPGDQSAASVRDTWFDTGDAVEVRGDRVYFRGRESSRINVGGEKVYPEEVESVIRRIDGVVDVRVSGLASAIVGQLVRAEIVPAAGVDAESLRRRVSEACREHLAAYKQPRIIQFVSDLAAVGTMKVQRRASQP